LAPVYEEVADAFLKEKSVVIAKVDCDAEKSLGARFGVQGFPTLKFFPKGSTSPVEYDGGRTADDLIAFINGKAGTRAAIYKAPSDVQVLTSENFDSVVLDSTKDVFVEFYAPWCGHCKSLAPVWEKLATAYKLEDDVVIANVDADKYKDVGGKYGVTGFPTLKFFPKNNKEGVTYSEGRDMKDFVKYLNEKTESQRLENGRLAEHAGLFTDLSEIAKQFVDSADKAGLKSQAEAIVSGLKGKDKENAQWYSKYFNIIEKKGKDFIQTEKDRLKGMLESGSAAGVKLD
jgi:protein disulfide-isomerase-like protein